MQSDFHYCCIRVLAEKAGFSPEEAQIIAYASQYVDDATEHKKIKIDKAPEEAGIRFQDGQFNPVCTSYKGIGLICSFFKEDIQRKVFIPFHFVPREKYQGQNNYSYRAGIASGLSRLMLNEAIEFFGKGINRLLGLIKIGVALHSYADSWSHNNFSGRHSSEDNDIEDLCVKKGSRWRKFSFFEQLAHNILPDIGHAEAGNLPDISHLAWKYRHAASGKIRIRDNSYHFLDAALVIFQIFCDINHPFPSRDLFLDSFGTIKECLRKKTNSLEKKLSFWQKLFPEIEFSYHPHDWRKMALDGNVDWDGLMTQKDYDARFFKWKGDVKFFYFHLAAQRQREFILSCIKPF